MMEMATIVPQRYIDITKDSKMHMALAHLVGVEGMEKYTEFFENAQGFRILDNGLIENAQVTVEDLLQKAELINADELILPDVYKDSRETFRRVSADIKWLRGHGYEKKIQVVPQGDSLDDWLKCAMALITNFGTEIDTIGIPKHLIDTAADRDARLKAIAMLDEMCPTFRSFDIHLLGCWKTPLEVLTIAKAAEQGIIPVVRSCDSAIAYVYARKGLKFCDDDRPDNKPIDFADGKIKEELLLEYNVASWICVGDPDVERGIYFI